MTEVKSALRFSSCNTSVLQSIPIDIVNPHLIVPPLVRIWVRQNLPVEPRNPRGINLGRPLLDICITSTDTDRTASVAVVVRRISVACAPLLHDELLACLLRARDVFLQLGSGKVADAIGVDGEDVECSTGEVWVEKGIGKISPAAGGDQYVLATSECGLQRFSHRTLPARESCRVTLSDVNVSDYTAQRLTYLWMHGFVLGLECKDVLRALRPGLAGRRIDVSKHMVNAVLELGNRIFVCVEVSSAIPLPVEVFFALQRIVAVDGNQKLDAVAMCFDHEFIETVEDSVVPSRGRVSLES